MALWARIENGPSRKPTTGQGEVLVSLLGQAGKAELDDPLARGEFMRAPGAVPGN